MKKLHVIIVKNCETCPYIELLSPSSIFTDYEGREIWGCRKDGFKLVKKNLKQIDKRCTIEQMEYEEE
jgi:hypothetical protein